MNAVLAIQFQATEWLIDWLPTSPALMSVVHKLALLNSRHFFHDLLFHVAVVLPFLLEGLQPAFEGGPLLQGGLGEGFLVVREDGALVDGGRVEWRGRGVAAGGRDALLRQRRHPRRRLDSVHDHLRSSGAQTFSKSYYSVVYLL